jgi:tellurite resistance protein TerC
MEKPLWAWLVFGGTLALFLAIDLFLHRGGRETSRKAALAWSGVWIAVGLAFSAVVYFAADANAVQEYMAAYLLEKSLSVDNMFVFLLIFGALGIPQQNQHTALVWGILGALVFRGIFIFLGVAALERWDWITYVFGGILFIAAFQAFREDLTAKRESPIVNWLSSHLPVSGESKTDHFWIKDNGRRMVTPLFVALCAIEVTDVIFAVDSVPAALSVSQDRFIVYSSNAFAILGLRALYLALAGYLTRLNHLHYGLAAVLAFAGFKMVAHDWVEVPPLISIVIIVGCIGITAGASFWGPGKDKESKSGGNDGKGARDERGRGNAMGSRV